MKDLFIYFIAFLVIAAAIYFLGEAFGGFLEFAMRHKLMMLGFPLAFFLIAKFSR